MMWRRTVAHYPHSMYKERHRKLPLFFTHFLREMHFSFNRGRKDPAPSNHFAFALVWFGHEFTAVFLNLLADVERTQLCNWEKRTEVVTERGWNSTPALHFIWENKRMGLSLITRFSLYCVPFKWVPLVFNYCYCWPTLFGRFLPPGRAVLNVCVLFVVVARCRSCAFAVCLNFFSIVRHEQAHNRV